MHTLLCCDVHACSLKFECFWFRARLWSRVKSCVLQCLLLTPPFRLKAVPTGASAVRHIVALLDSWSINMFTDHVVALQTRTKFCWCCISYAVTQGYFGGCCCGWVGLARRQHRRKMEREYDSSEMQDLNLALETHKCSQQSPVLVLLSCVYFIKFYNVTW